MLDEFNGQTFFNSRPVSHWKSRIGEYVSWLTPPRDSEGEVIGGISLTFPAIALPESKLQKVARLVVKAANHISIELGWKDGKKSGQFYQTGVSLVSHKFAT